MTISQTILLGAFSGVIASALIFLASKLYNSWLHPYLLTLRYTGSAVDGEWFAAPVAMDQNFKLEIEQKATNLCGLVTLVARDKEKSGYYEEIRSFKLQGEIRDRFVILHGRTPDNSRIGAITFLLEVIGDGRQLVGTTSFYSVSHFKISTEEILFTRDSYDPEMMRQTPWIFEFKGFTYRAYLNGIARRPELPTLIEENEETDEEADNPKLQEKEEGAIKND